MLAKLKIRLRYVLLDSPILLEARRVLNDQLPEQVNKWICSRPLMPGGS